MQFMNGFSNVVVLFVNQMQDAGNEESNARSSKTGDGQAL